MMQLTQGRSTVVPGLLANALRLHQAGRFDEAERIYRQVLSVDKRHADSLHLLGLIEYKRGEYEAAAELIGQAISIDKRQAAYHSNLGAVLQAQGKFGEAAVSYRRAIRIKPDLADAYNHLGVALAAQGEIEEAMAQYQRALEIDPKNVDAQNNWGVALAERGETVEAMVHYGRALELDPKHADTFCNLGNALLARDETADAAACFEQAVALNPELAAAHNGLGNTMLAQNKMEAAALCFGRALTIKPGYADALYGLAMARLLLMEGDFTPALRNYERRWETGQRMPLRTYPFPLWNGEKLAAGRVLLWGEQGVGDEVMFAGLIPDVLRRGNRCVVDCDARLVELFRRSFPGVDFVCSLKTGEEAGMDLAAHLPTGSLPGIFRTSREAFAATSAAYLKPDEVRRQKFRARYSNGRRLVGLAWHTRNKESGRKRSIDLPLLASLFASDNIEWISLQYGNHDELERQAQLAGAPLLIDRTVDQFADVDGFAAQIAALDLVITIDNTTAHLAGALGMPVWLMLPFVCEWRWFRRREDSVWYPSMRLFRQPEPGDWASVVREVKGALG